MAGELRVIKFFVQVLVDITTMVNKHIKCIFLNKCILSSRC